MAREIRLLHIADVHLGSDTDPTTNLLPLARFLARWGDWADLLVVAGDLFDHNRVGEELIDGLAECLGKVVRSVILPGNHDALSGDSVYWRCDWKRQCPSCRIIRRPEGEWVTFLELGLAVWGRPTVVHAPTFRPLAQAPPKPVGMRAVAVAHGEFFDAAAAPYPVGSPILRSDLPAEWDYVALGHKPQWAMVSTRPPAVYAGNLVASDGQPQGTLVILDDEGVAVARCGADDWSELGGSRWRRIKREKRPASR